MAQTTTTLTGIDEFEQDIEQVSHFLRYKGLTIMRNVLDRLIMAYLSASSGQVPENPIGTTERQIQTVINRLKAESRPDLAEALEKFQAKTVELVNNLS